MVEPAGPGKVNGRATQNCVHKMGQVGLPLLITDRTELQIRKVGADALIGLQDFAPESHERARIKMPEIKTRRTQRVGINSV